MAAYGTKPNKCFARVPELIYSAANFTTIPGTATTPRQILFSDASIDKTQTAIVTPRITAETMVAFQSGQIEINHAISDGAVVVYITNKTGNDLTINVNVMVIE